MENSQFSILTALFGGKPSAGAPAGGGTLLADPSGNEHKDAHGFFSFLEGLLKSQEAGNADASTPLGAQPAFAAPAFEIARERLNSPSEPVITTGGAETLGIAAAPGAPAGAQLSGDAAPVEASVLAAKTAQGVREAASGGLASSAAVENAATQTPAAGDADAGLQTPGLKAAGQAPDKNTATPVLADMRGATDAPVETGALEFETPRETNRGRTEDAPGIAFAARHDAKAPGSQLSANANALAAIAEQASPHGLHHSALTREEGGLEFDRVASSRFDTVSAAADRNIHLHPVRDQIVAAVTARHGDGKLEIRLDPPELGRVTIGFESDGADLVRAVISADSPETLDLMRRHADVFQRALEDQGFEGLDLQFTDRGAQENPADEAGDKNHAFSLTDEEQSAAIAAASAPQAALGRLDRWL